MRISIHWIFIAVMFFGFASFAQKSSYKTSAELNLWTPGSVVPSNTINPDSLQYMGVFRMPDVGTIDPPYDTWRYGGYGIAYVPNGDPSGPEDGFPGSLFGVGHTYAGMISEVTIPVPVISNQASALHRATTLQPFVKIDGVPPWPSADIIRGMTWLPGHGSPAGGRLYFGRGTHFPDNTLPNHGWCSTDLSAPDAAGPWHIGNLDHVLTGYHVFSIPQAWADSNTNGRSIVTGRSRWGWGPGDGPKLFAIAPWQDGNPPPVNGNLGYTTLLHYHDGDDSSIFAYRICDNWTGGAWLNDGPRAAVVLKAYLGYGNVWYDHALFADSAKCCLQFWNPADLAAVAKGTMAEWAPQPYATLDVSATLVRQLENGNGFDVRHEGMAYDDERGILYSIERNAFYGEDAPVVHVWKIKRGDATSAETKSGKMDGFSLCAMPNPFNAVVKIAVRGHQPIHSQNTVVRIFNMRGTLVQALSATYGSLSSGITWEASNQPSGVYVVRVQTGATVISKAITLMR